ncbi:galactokinase-like [Episyrphus balteatus]|uniref:galactokinase-like n=1 Tax=Episyrphus balteatus TaxID=286459 RepID=UPI002485B603|nr:galactokinase-like [Episyrphus balteatus]
MSGLTTKLPTFEEIEKIAKETYKLSFGKTPEISCCAPGRVNLIGEHVDYNDGFVLPMALPMVTIIVGGPNGKKDEADIVTRCDGADEPKKVRVNLKTLQPGTPKWANYVKGVIHSFGHPVAGFNAVIVSNVPVGGGLSSSAALEVATLTFLEQLTGKAAESNARRALICQEAEHKFVGMPCGIMDQMISVAGKKDHALLIDCRSLETFQIPFLAKDLVVLICNSNVRHELSDSEYPTRRKQCTEALRLMDLKSYRDATEGNLSALDGAEEVLLKRARHVITEIKRTQLACEAMRDCNFEEMGKLMTQSHVSLRDDFAVSCDELDVLVASAINCAGVLGSRMTGGGFGGCTVTLVGQSSVGNVIARMRENFNEKFNNSGQNLEFYICTPSDGTRRI